MKIYHLFKIYCTQISKTMPFKLFAFLLFVCCSLKAQSPFDSFKSSDAVSYISVSNQMFQLLGKLKINTDDPDTQAFFDTVQQIKGFRVMSTKEVAIGTAMAEWIREQNLSTDLEPIINLNEAEASVSFSAAYTDDPNRIKRLVMYVEGLQNIIDANKDLQMDAENLEYILLEIKGNIALDQLARLTELVDIPGGQFLKELN